MYAFSSTKNLYIFDKISGKLVSLLLVPINEIEINGIVVAPFRESQAETMIIYSLTNMFKLDSEI